MRLDLQSQVTTALIEQIFQTTIIMGQQELLGNITGAFFLVYSCCFFEVQVPFHVSKQSRKRGSIKSKNDVARDPICKTLVAEEIV